MLSIAKEFDASLEPQYNKHYIGIFKSGQPFNFCTFRPSITSASVIGRNGSSGLPVLLEVVVLLMPDCSSGSDDPHAIATFVVHHENQRALHHANHGEPLLASVRYAVPTEELNIRNGRSYNVGMKQVSASKFQEQCLALLDRVGPEIVVTKRGKPVAKLIPFGANSASLIGSLKGKLRIKGEIVSTGIKWDAER